MLNSELQLQIASVPFYQSLLAEANKGDEFCAKTRCDPKLTEGSEIVREVPRPSSRETFRD
jgi:hypothetical protein